MIAELYALLIEDTFRRFDLKIIRTKSFHYQLDVLRVLLVVFEVNQDVVQIDYHELVEIRSQYFVHHCLKCDRSIRQFEKHNAKFVLVSFDIECCFITIFFDNIDLSVLIS